MNPMAVVKLKPQLDKFTENHPGIPQFLHTAASGMEEDGYVQLKVTNAAGQKIEANIKLTADDRLAARDTFAGGRPLKNYSVPYAAERCFHIISVLSP